ncbi:MAG: sterol desaturase family protein [Candidatus Eremiobacteraeota bacterium]|nr:sterol desaturase family protein [Candidatus Eremiobacteraeota bacterium]
MIAQFLRHGSNALLAVLLVFIGVAFVTMGTSVVIWGFLLGMVIFFTSEYSTHRFLFHAKPMKNAFILHLQHRLHYDHHTEPDRLGLLFLPPWFVLPVFALYGLVYLAITKQPALALSLLAGNLLALFYYEWVHYVAHVPFVPVTAYGKWIKKYHLLHHFKNEHFWFGVTNPSMDVLSRTYREKEDVTRSATTRQLY